jgi:hypothetical protein
MPRNQGLDNAKLPAGASSASLRELTEAAAG